MACSTARYGGLAGDATDDIFRDRVDERGRPGRGCGCCVLRDAEEHDAGGPARAEATRRLADAVGVARATSCAPRASTRWSGSPSLIALLDFASVYLALRRRASTRRPIAPIVTLKERHAGGAA